MATLASYITKSFKKNWYGRPQFLVVTSVLFVISVLVVNWKYWGGWWCPRNYKEPNLAPQLLILDHIWIHFNIHAREAHHEFRHILIEKRMQEAYRSATKGSLVNLGWRPKRSFIGQINDFWTSVTNVFPQNRTFWRQKKGLELLRSVSSFVRQM
jgi:hypothetical protein